MNTTKADNPRQVAVAASDCLKDPAVTSRGLRTLLDGMDEAEPLTPVLPSEPAQPQAPREKGRRQLPKLAFFLADALLLAASVLVIFGRPGPPPIGLMIFCGLLVGVGAMIALLPFWMERNEAPPLEFYNGIPRWILGNSGKGDSRKLLVVHLHWPRFVGEVIDLDGEARVISPRWFDGAASMDIDRKKELLREAEAFCRGRNG